LGLLRLRHAPDSSPADVVVAEMDAIRASTDDPSASEERKYPVLDVDAGYARWAEVYDVAANPLIAAEEPVVRDLLEGTPGDPVVDAACGTGRHMVWLHEIGRSVIGVDQSPAMLSRARAKLPTADLRSGQLERLPVADGSAAGVLCTMALDHVADLSAVFREFHRIVSAGGWAIISVLHPLLSTIAGWTAWFVDDEGRSDVATQGHQVSDYLNAASAAGFRLRRCLEIPLEPGQVRAPPGTEASTPFAFHGLPFVLVASFESTS
jgi:ubiquinone/menaquinone biosynthesis C-methylase UbiE